MDPCHYIQERTQKITEALYRVTDLFSDKEPIKWLLRKKGINIFNCLSFLGNNSSARRLKNIEIVPELIGSILCVLEVASAGAFISAVNFEVLRREYRALADFINNSKKDILPSPTALLFDSAPKEVLLENNSKGHFNEQTDLVTADLTPVNSLMIQQEVLQDGIKDFNGHSLIVKDNDKDTNQKINNKEEKNFNNSGNNANIKNRKIIQKDVLYNNDNEAEIKFGRQKKILEFVKNNGWVGVKEVSVIFDKNISEKTVQRDLIVMADSGVLRKAGDKRWRRYAAV
ncbi:MAG: DeoR family transcriptional regulator [Patescibacteria group bacterium]